MYCRNRKMSSTVPEVSVRFPGLTSSILSGADANVTSPFTPLGFSHFPHELVHTCGKFILTALLLPRLADMHQKSNTRHVGPATTAEVSLA